jgi:hypothetical protein
MLVARDRGQDIVKVSVDVDGKRIQDSLDGVAMPLDPGPHTIRLTLAGRPPIEQTFVAREGDKSRQLVVDFGAGPAAEAPAAPPNAPPPDGAAPSSFHVPAAAWVLGGITVVAAGSFAVLGTMGKSDLDHLRDTCGVTHSCAQSDVDAIHSKMLVADISLYTGIAALAAATVITIAANHRPSPATTGLRGPSLVLTF